eukprot:scaffold11238_cov150-Skeletonema_marinoi.AAC.3
MSTTNTIKFNVGGRPFEVSRDLMEKHSETMLGKLVSEAWQADPEEPVFIDRNGNIFEYVLDYLRYGSIELPRNVPKSSFERDLDFYGLLPKEGEIKEKSLADMAAALRQDRDSAKSNFVSAQSKYEMFVFATEVQHQYIMKNQISEKEVPVQILVNKIRENGDFGKDRCDYLNETEDDLFMSYLGDLFGLRMATESECKNWKNSTSPHPCLYKGFNFFVMRK